MNSRRLPDREIVLLGAGHTNMHIVRQWKMWSNKLDCLHDCRLTLISPLGVATYSGMLPGTLAGHYIPDEMTIDLVRFTAGTDIRLIKSAATGLDPEKRLVLFQDRPSIRFDILSIGVGSVPGGIPQTANVLSVKPMTTFLKRFEAAVESNKSIERLGIVGGGAAGVELAFCLSEWFQKRNKNPRLTLIEAGDTILPAYTRRTRRLVERELDSRGIERHTNLYLGSEDLSEYDLVIWVTGATSPPVFERFPLSKAEDGFLATRPTLQVISGQPIFAVGDSGTIVDSTNSNLTRSPVLKAGVHAVRQGPILWANITNLLTNKPLRNYVPQKNFLSLLTDGKEKAFVDWGRWSSYGNWAFRWKDWIDRRFMRMYQNYAPTEMNQTPLAEKKHGRIRCAGCGGKVSGEVLRETFAELKIPTDSRILNENPLADDAVVLGPGTKGEILTVDFFEAFSKDPYLVGRVGAIHAMGDIWAMGGEPQGALALVTLPEGTIRAQKELLVELLTGAREELTRWGASLWGGHTIEGDRLTIGFQVTGTNGGEKPWWKRDLNEGDELVLTKPLGTGVLLASEMLGLLRAEWQIELERHLVRGQGDAVRLGREYGVMSATDITGFGLAGHLLEMLKPKNLSARISISSIPLLSGFDELSRRGVESSLAESNRNLIAEFCYPTTVASGGREPPVSFRYETLNSGATGSASASSLKESGGSRPPRAAEVLYGRGGIVWPRHNRRGIIAAAGTRQNHFRIMADPQTSGGLLMAIPQGRGERFCDQLRELGHTGAAVIGGITNELGTRIYFD